MRNKKLGKTGEIDLYRVPRNQKWHSRCGLDSPQRTVIAGVYAPRQNRFTMSLIRATFRGGLVYSEHGRAKHQNADGKF